MSDRFPVLRSLDPYHARIGYLGALAVVSTRGIDRQDALVARFHELLFERVYDDDPRLPGLLDRVPVARRAELLKCKSRPEEEDPTAVFTEPASAETEVPPADWILERTTKRPKPRLVKTNWLYMSELWLFDKDMPSPVGHIPREKLDRTIDLARWTGVLLPTLELSEAGYLIQHLLGLARAGAANPEAFNPLIAGAHPALPLLYFRILLANELLFPFLIDEMVQRHRSGRVLVTRGEEALLLAAADRLLKVIGDVFDPEDALAIRAVDQFRQAIAPSKPSTQENYLRPRLEMLVDLGLLGRRPLQGNTFMWEVTTATEALADALRPFTSPMTDVAATLESFMDAKYFGAMAAVLAPGHVPVSDESECMRLVAEAFQSVAREFGFTPGRTLALKACLLAWEQGRTMEVKDVFDAVYKAGAHGSELEQFLHFSGGSRFDREFLIRIEPGLGEALGRSAAKGA